MNKQDTDEWHASAEEHNANQLLAKYESDIKHHRNVRNWLILVCLVLAIVCGLFFRELREEIALRHFYQIEYQYYSQLATHYKMLYTDYLNQEQNELSSP